MSARLGERLHRAKFSWNFTREVLNHGRWKSLRQAVGNFRHLPGPTDNQEQQRLTSVPPDRKGSQ